MKMVENIEKNIVSNDTLASNRRTLEYGLVQATATTPNQLYRNSDNKYFKPTLIIATNEDTANNELLKLVDADLTDSGEDTYKAATYVKFEFWVLAGDTVVLTEDQLKGLIFRYGVGGYVTTGTTGVVVYIAGYEV